MRAIDNKIDESRRCLMVTMKIQLQINTQQQ